jgi:WD40 repeat protein
MYSLRNSVQSGQSAVVASGNGGASSLLAPVDGVCCIDIALSVDASSLAVALSNRVVKTYDSLTLRPTHTFTLPQHGNDVLRGVQWSDSEPHSIFAASGSDDWGPGNAHAPRSANIFCFDTRTGRAETTLRLDALANANDAGEFGAFAVSASGSLIAVGLGPSIAFCDLRAVSNGNGNGSSSSSSNSIGSSLVPRTLGFFSESHSEAISCLSFHPTLREHVLSGGDDGLVCIFDTRITGENDAIVSVLSAGSSVARVGVFGTHGAFAHVLTRTGGISLWNIGSAEQMASFPSLLDTSRSASLPGGIDFLVACHYDTRRDSLSLLAGSHEGALHSFDVTPSTVSLTGTLPRGHLCGVRAAAWTAVGSDTGGLVFTAGEDGRVCQWADTSALERLGSSRPQQGTGVGVSKRESGVLKRELAYANNPSGGRRYEEAATFGLTASAPVIDD